MVKENLELNSSNMPRNWQMPNPIYNWATGSYEAGGMAWCGQKPATPANVKALRAALGPKVKIDRPTLRGKKDPKYSRYDQRKMNHKDYKKRTVVLG